MTETPIVRPDGTLALAAGYDPATRFWLQLDRDLNALRVPPTPSQEDARQALAFLHTDILFYGDPESHAEALYNLDKLWQQVDRPERALQCRNILKNQYPGSPWNKDD